MRMLPITNRAADYAPVAPVCCNAYRICATQGVIGLVVGGAGAIGAVAVGLAAPGSRSGAKPPRRLSAPE
jgi:hypothetical protein